MLTPCPGAAWLLKKKSENLHATFFLFSPVCLSSNQSGWKYYFKWNRSVAQKSLRAAALERTVAVRCTWRAFQILTLTLHCVYMLNDAFSGEHGFLLFIGVFFLTFLPVSHFHLWNRDTLEGALQMFVCSELLLCDSIEVDPHLL